jgi:hypothetical protein
MQPAEFLARVLSRASVSWGIVQQDSEAAKILDGVLTVPLPLLLTVSQYYLIGLLLDKLFIRRELRSTD